MKIKLHLITHILPAVIIAVFAIMHLTGCAGTGSTSSASSASTTSAVLGTSESIANLLLPVAATVYGGAEAGQATQNGLYSLENQLNPLVGQTVPVSVVQNGTGTAALDDALVSAGVVKPGKTLTVGDIQTLDAAAQIAPALASALSNPNAALRNLQMRRIANYLDHRLQRPGAGRQIVTVFIQSNIGSRQ